MSSYSLGDGSAPCTPAINAPLTSLLFPSPPLLSPLVPSPPLLSRPLPSSLLLSPPLPSPSPLLPCSLPSSLGRYRSLPDWYLDSPVRLHRPISLHSPFDPRPIHFLLIISFVRLFRSFFSGGRLAYLIPTVLGFSADDLPKHPCLRYGRTCC